MDQLFSRGIQLYNLNRYPEAIKVFNESLSLNPNDFYSKFYLALCYYYIDDFITFEKISSSIITDFPDNDESYYLLMLVSLSKKNYQNALNHITKAIQFNPYEADYFGYKAIIQINLKLFNEALASSNEGLNIDAKNKFCLNTRTQSLTKLKQKEEAFSTLKNTLSDNPEDYFTQANAGWTKLELGNYSEANDHFKEALKINPNDDYAREGMIESLKAKNIIYRYFLKYAFWIQNKGDKFKWGLIIGIYLIYRFSSSVIENLGFTFLLPVLAFLYLAFVLGSWLITPISNAILLFDSYGKNLLKRNDLNSGSAFLIIFLTAIIASILNISFNNNHYFSLISVSSFCSLIPITIGIQNEIKFYKSLAFWYGFFIFILGFINLITPISIFVPIIMLAVFTWGYNFKKE